MGIIKIGWSKENITPIGEVCEKVSLVGQFYERITEKIRDPIYATVLVIESETKSSAIVISLDLCYVSKNLMIKTREYIKSTIPDVAPESILMAATHIHTGPDLGYEYDVPMWGTRFSSFSKDPAVITPTEYTDFAAKKIAAAAASAWNSRSPGGIIPTFGRVSVPQCRRVCYKDGSSKMYGRTDTNNFLRIEGGADTGVEYIFTFDLNKKMTGVVINLACPAQILENEKFITADLWGELRRQWPECPYILPLCGAAGDITMRDMVRRDKNEQIMSTEEGMIQQAGRILRESRYVLSEIKMEEIMYEPQIRHVVRYISLPIMTVNDNDYIKAKAIYDAYENEYKRNDFSASYGDSIPLRRQDRGGYATAAGIVNRYQLQSEHNIIEMEIHALRIGDAALITNPFELYQDYGMQIKARSQANQTFIAQLSCGNLGYLPTELSIAGGGYSTGVSNGYIGPEGGCILVDKSLDMINNMFI